MLTVAEAHARILAAARILTGQTHLALSAASGRVLAQDIMAPMDVPPCDNSAMDGYAVRAADVAVMPSLPVVGVIYAGGLPGELAPGTAQRIFTGAPVPAGADSVVIQEDVKLADGAMVIGADVAVPPGGNIRCAGEDIRKGDCIVRRGYRLRAQEVGLLAAAGIASVPVMHPLRVGLLSTGDELLEPGDTAQPGKVFNSNRYLLGAMLRDLGCEVVDAGRVADDLSTTVNALQALSRQADVLLSTGGVSVGDADYVKQAVQQLGHLDVWKIAVKPGKPLAFGHVCGKAFFGLPGNPVSAFVTFTLFVRPFLQQAQGAIVQDLPVLPVHAAFALETPGKREEYLRVILQREAGRLVAVMLPNQGSGVLSSVCRADALLRVPAGKTVSVGDVMDCLLLA